MTDIAYDRPGITAKSVLLHPQAGKNELNPILMEPAETYSRYLYEHYNDTDVFCFVWPAVLIDYGAMALFL